MNARFPFAVAVFTTLSLSLAAQTPIVAPGYPLTFAGNAVSSPALVDLDGDPDLEMVQVIGSNGAGSSVVVLNPDGTAVPGWPAFLGSGTFASPAIGDVDGDGQPEVVVQSFFFGAGGSLYVFEADGSTKPGFPMTLGGTLKNPALCDVDLDGDLEIVVTVNILGVANVFVLQGDGSTLPGWPQTLDSTAGAAPTVGDVDNDGVPEVFAPSYEMVWGFDAGGNVLPGFPIDLLTQAVSYSTITLADLDLDGDRELVFGTQDEVFIDQPGRIHALHHDGTNVVGWPVMTNSSVYTPPSVADIDNDGQPDVIAGDQELSPVPVNSLFAFDAAGNPKPGFPIDNIDAFHQQITIADVDGDTFVELLCETNVAGDSYRAFNHDGTPVAGWPLPTSSNTQCFNQQLAVGDIDADGLLEIVGTVEAWMVGQTEFYVWETGVPFVPALAPVPTQMYGNSRAGHVNGDRAPILTEYGCGLNPAGSLTALSGGALPGDILIFGVDNPLGTQAPGSLAILAYNFAGIANPCGVSVPGFGMAGGGAAGELVLAPGFLILSAQVWVGAGVPTQFGVILPASPSLIGSEHFFQGAILGTSFFGLTNGMRARIGI